MKICEQLLLQFLLFTVDISRWVLFLLLIQQTFFKGLLQGLKSSPQDAQWQAPLLFEKKEKLTEMVTRCHSLSLIVPLVVIPYSLSLFVICCHSLSLVVPLVAIRCYLLSFVLTRCTTRCHSLSLDVLIVCLFVNDLLRQS